MQIVSPFQCIVIIVQQRERTEMPIRDISKYMLAININSILHI